ncbi:glycosyltransferase family 1 protein [Bizionia argentinensis JUB59]|uniref:Glycosyltransferase family 1 protein n=1 Tax=Bizionia argentinensis JUB59 TaxID=1046627 RepID=G2EES6_9FLAO|nr:glycosyltransferase [Bizionia argentinensis]EGV43064.1 glycosyltransferase family 1 protein [Bizionia argentinensis JUB59]
MNIKNKIYFCFPLSGPNNGVQVISSYILNEFIKDDEFEILSIDIAQAEGFNNFGKFKFKKLIDTLGLFMRLTNIREGDLVFLNFTPKGFAFYRDFIMILISKLKGGNVTVHVHANGLEKKFNALIKLLLKKIKIIVINKSQYNNLKNKHSNLFLINNALPDFFQGNKMDFSQKEDEINLLFFSNLSKEKGIYRLEEIIKLVGRSDLNCKFNIYGGILDKSNESIFNRLKLEYDFIHYFGPISDEKEKFKIFAKSDLLLFLSNKNYEVSPLVYIEALMSGLPIITTNQVVSDAIVSAKCGYHISEDVSEIITVLQEYKQNVILREELRHTCRNLYLTKYSFGNFINQIKTVIVK